MENNSGETSSSRSSIGRNPMHNTISPPRASNSRNQVTGRISGSVLEQVKKPIHHTLSPPLVLDSCVCADYSAEKLVAFDVPPLYPTYGSAKRILSCNPHNRKIRNWLTF
jgi:hypothetical protein